MKKIALMLFVGTFLSGLSQAAPVSKKNLTAQVLFQPGYVMPLGHLSRWIKPGFGIRLKVFGGIRIPTVKWVGSAGIGLDLSFSHHHFKDRPILNGYAYRRLTWDWLVLPIHLNRFRITPGFIWTLTDIRHPDLGLDETSIRPGGSLTLGYLVPLSPRYSLRGSLRGEALLPDRERTKRDASVNITGSFFSVFLGVEGNL